MNTAVLKSLPATVPDSPEFGPDEAAAYVQMTGFDASGSGEEAILAQSLILIGLINHIPGLKGWNPIREAWTRNDIGGRLPDLREYCRDIVEALSEHGDYLGDMLLKTPGRHAFDAFFIDALLENCRSATAPGMRP